MYYFTKKHIDIYNKPWYNIIKIKLTVIYFCRVGFHMHLYKSIFYLLNLYFLNGKEIYYGHKRIQL